MRLIDADNLKEHFRWSEMCRLTIKEINDIIDNASTVARTDKPFICIDGVAVYITQGHIDALLEYEKNERLKEFVNDFIKSLDDLKEMNCDNCVHHIDDVCEHCYESNVNWCTGYRSAGDNHDVQ